MKSGLVLILGYVLTATSVSAQDSARVAATLVEILQLCKSVDFAEPEVQKQGAFYRVAPFIIYRGKDEKRRWQVPANYSNTEEKEQVNQICYRINSTVNQDPAYRITAYYVRKEKEGIWHVLEVQYLKRGSLNGAAFGFLQKNGKFLLGDID